MFPLQLVCCLLEIERIEVKDFSRLKSKGKHDSSFKGENY